MILTELWKEGLGNRSDINNNFGFDIYNVPDALSPQAPMDPAVFMNGEPPVWGFGS